MMPVAVHMGTRHRNENLDALDYEVWVDRVDPIAVQEPTVLTAMQLVKKSTDSSTVRECVFT